MDEITQTFGAGFGLVIIIFGTIWGILLFLLPFFVFGASRRAKECSDKLDRLIAIQERAHPAPQSEGAAAQQSDGWS